MRTFVSPIGYDTRRVTRPVVNTGLSGEDTVQLLRPGEESDTERAAQAIADVEQLLQEIEPEASCEVTRISTGSFENTVRECCAVLASIPDDHETLVSLGGGARDVLLPLTISSIVFTEEIDRALFFSDLDSTIRDLSLPSLTARVPERADDTFAAVVAANGWISLSDIAAKTGLSKSTVIRHVQDLEKSDVLETETREKEKFVRPSFSGELFWTAQTLEPDSADD